MKALSARARMVSVAALVAGCVGGSARDERPNIVIIMADDMGWSDIGAYGSEIRTPNIDRLAAEGVRFTQFYNGARCVPTRAALLTGRYAHQVGLGHMNGDWGAPGYRGDLDTLSLTIAEVMRDGGYRTYMSGKWHVSNRIGHWTGQQELRSIRNWPAQRGFDRFFGTIIGAGSYFDSATLTEQNMPVDSVGAGFYYTDEINDRAATFIRDHRRDHPDRPFFLYVAQVAPHWPLHARPEDVDRYRGTYDAGWDAIRAARYRRMIGMGLMEPGWALSPRDADVPDWQDLTQQERAWYARAMEVYAAQVDRMDQGIGRMLAALEETGAARNTLILFLSDNGGCAEVLSDDWRSLYVARETRTGGPVTVGNEHRDVLPGPEETYMSYGAPWANVSNTPFRRFKHWVHEGGIATPLIARWPAGIARAGTVTHEPGHIIDVMATAVDVAGLELPAERGGARVPPLEGRSLVAAFNGGAIDRDALFWEHEGNRAVRQGRWKAVAVHEGAWELYDIEADRTELHDLAAQQPERLKELVAMYDRWADRSSVLPWPARLHAQR